MACQASLVASAILLVADYASYPWRQPGRQPWRQLRHQHIPGLPALKLT